MHSQQKHTKRSDNESDEEVKHQDRTLRSGRVVRLQESTDTTKKKTNESRKVDKISASPGLLSKLSKHKKSPIDGAKISPTMHKKKGILSRSMASIHRNATNIHNRKVILGQSSASPSPEKRPPSSTSSSPVILGQSSMSSSPEKKTPSPKSAASENQGPSSSETCGSYSSGGSLSLRIGPEVGKRKRSFSAGDVAFVKEIDKSDELQEFPESFEFRVSKDDWKSVWDMKTMKQIGDYPSIIQSWLLRNKIPCSYFSNGYTVLSKTSKLGVVKFRGYCGGGGKSLADSVVEDDETKVCKMKFMVYMQESEGEDYLFKVKTAGVFVQHQKQNVGRQIRGRTRQELIEKLQHEKAITTYLGKYTNTGDMELLHGNLPVRSADQIRRIKSQSNMINAEPFTDVDAAIDNLVETFKKNVKFQSTKFPSWNGYIQRYHKKPHALMLCSPDQIRYGGICDILYIDATGQMVHSRKENDKMKQVLLHSVVGLPSHIKDIKVTPVVEFLSTAGTANEIEIMLKTYCSEVKKAKPSWKPRLVVSDFCLAYLHGNSEAFCGMSLDKYINSKYDILVNEKAVPDEKSTTLFVCSGHFLLFNARYLRSHNINKEQNTTALFMFASLINASKVTEYKEVISDAVSLFGSKEFPEEERDRIVAKFKRQEGFDGDMFLEDYEATHKSEISMEDIFPEIDAKLQQEKSKFHVYFEKRAEEIIESTKQISDNRTVPRNPYYSPVVVKTLRRWNVYLPLWSKVGFAKHKHIPSESITTARVEQYFGQLKTSFHTSRNVREDIFIKIQSSMAQNMVTDALSRGFISKKANKPRAPKPAVTKPKQKQDKPKAKSDSSTGNPAFATAKWRKKRNKTARYLQRTPVPTQTNTQPPKSTAAEKSADATTAASDELMDSFKDLVPTYMPDKTMMDPMFISERWWVKESRLVPNLVPSSGDYPGDESDILTLRSSLLVSSSVAEQMSRIILGNAASENTYIIGQTLIEQTDIGIRSNNSNFSTAGKRILNYYDSAPGLVKDTERVVYYNEIENSLDAVYGIQQGLTYICKEMPLQIGNECVQMSLLALKACLMGKEPHAVVSPLYAKVYRHEILKSILPATPAGKKLWIAAEGNPNKVLDILQKREKERQFVTSILKRRNGIADAFFKYKKEAKNPSEYPNSVILGTKSLFEDIAKHETQLKQEQFLKSSEIEPEPSDSCSASQEELGRTGNLSQPTPGVDERANRFDDIDNELKGNNEQEAGLVGVGDNEDVGLSDEEENQTAETTAEQVANIPTSELLRMHGFEAIAGGFEILSGETSDGSKQKPQSMIIFEELTKRRNAHGGYYVQDFLAKKNLVTLHRSNIEKLSNKGISECIDSLFEEIQAISRGTCHCWRSEMFNANTSESKGKLQENLVSEPFSPEQAAYVYDEIVDKFFDAEHNAKTFPFIMKVLIPETLHRIYAATNKITYSTAEIELKDGFNYDGPVLQQ